jgi:ectoine hydroxylase-related dioxygenase (phytanoyl-CoA dioxygenase family)
LALVLQDTSEGPGSAAVAEPAGVLSPQQIAYFDTFGFVKLPGLFRPEIEQLTAGFEEVFADEANVFEIEEETLHSNQRRIIAVQFLDRSEKLSWLKSDRRVHGIVGALMPNGYEYSESDASCFYCETSWHHDSFGAPIERYHVKLSFYLDPLSADSGAIRVIPGTHHHQTGFARRLRRGLRTAQSIPETYGVDGRDIPAWTIDSEPGDVIVWNYRTMHASYNGGDRRRLFSVSFREPEPPAEA